MTLVALNYNRLYREKCRTQDKMQKIMARVLDRLEVAVDPTVSDGRREAAVERAYSIMLGEVYR